MSKVNQSLNTEQNFLPSPQNDSNKSEAQPSRIAEILIKYVDRFEGLGKLKDYKVKLHVDPSVPPVAQPPRRIPFHLRKKVSKELEILDREGIIEKVESATPWVSPVVVVPKPQDLEAIRLCIDMRMANRAIIREWHVTPTIEEIVQDLNGATVFSKLDLRSAYNQLELDEDSHSITTFCTQEGLHRYTRLNFGTCSAAEICQNVISQILSDIPNARNISDDVLVFGRSQADHDAALEAVMKRFHEKNLTRNQSKCAFSKSEINFFGLVFPAEGVGPDPKKVAAIKNAPHPNSQAEVRSLLGLATYMSRFIKDFSTITAPLCELTRKHASFKWQPCHQTALDRLKEALTSEDVIAYFDPNKETHLIVDTLPGGLGDCFAQKVRETKDEYKIVAYASHSLSPTERHYAQTEREALSVVWGIECFNLYLLGAQFTLHTDHHPLETIFNNPKSCPPARIKHWLLQLQPYNFHVVYLPGKDNPTDYLSRHPVDSYSLHNCKQAEVYVNFISHFATPKAMSLSEIKRETTSDPTMQELAKLI